MTKDELRKLAASYSLSGSRADGERLYRELRRAGYDAKRVTIRRSPDSRLTTHN